MSHQEWARVLTLIGLVGCLIAGTTPTIAEPAQAVVSVPSPIWGWVRFSSPTTEDLHGLAVVSGNDIWAVGSKGTILHWDGFAWTKVPSPVTSELWAVTMIVSSGDNGQAVDGWIVGWDATLLRWQNNTWTKVTSPVARDFVDVSVVISPTQSGGAITEGWALGLGASLRWHNNQWEQFAELDNRYLYSISMLSPTEAIAVGDFGSIGHWDGQHWTGMSCRSCPFPPRMLTSVSMVAANDAWAVGNGGTCLHYNGIDWQPVVNPNIQIDKIR